MKVLRITVLTILHIDCRQSTLFLKQRFPSQQNIIFNLHKTSTNITCNDAMLLKIDYPSKARSIWLATIHH